MLDGPTNSKDGFTGPVGKLLSSVENMKYNDSFTPLSSGEALIIIPDEILNKMSTDQKIAYKLCQAVKSGNMPVELQEIKCGKLNHSRWLTTGIRIVYMWTSHHGLSGKKQNIFQTLVKYCLESYFKCYFDIKVLHQLEDGPYHILTELRILRTQPKIVQDIVTIYVRTGAWYAHSENVLLSLLSSKSLSDRTFAIDKILTMRGNSDLGNMSVRQRITPKLNLNATSLQQLISWKENELDEPVFTCSLTKKQLTSLIEKPLVVPHFNIHSQSTERAVKQVTEAASAVVGAEARDGYVRARAQHREILPVFRTKRDILCTLHKLK